MQLTQDEASLNQKTFKVSDGQRPGTKIYWPNVH